MRHSDTIIISVTSEGTAGPPVECRVRRFLKIALRSCQLRCVDIRLAKADAVDAGEPRADEPAIGTGRTPMHRDARQAASETSPVTRVTELSEHSSSSQETEPCHHGAGSATGRRQGIAVGQHERSDVEPGIGTADAPTRQIERQAGKVGPE